MSTTTELQHRLDTLETRLQVFEDVQAIRDCVLRYLDLCDHLDTQTPMDELGDCFTADAFWAGKGARYGASFGGHQGRAAIVTMLGAYRGSEAQPPHFRFNAHFLTSEQIRATGPGLADAGWLMLQTSSFSAGGSHLNAASLRLQMQRGTDGRWRIARFETENLLSRPVSTWHSDAALPVPAIPTTSPTGTAA
jgi:hypothetical protein